MFKKIKAEIKGKYNISSIYTYTHAHAKHKSVATIIYFAWSSCCPNCFGRKIIKESIKNRLWKYKQPNGELIKLWVAILHLLSSHFLFLKFFLNLIYLLLFFFLVLPHMCAFVCRHFKVKNLKELDDFPFQKLSIMFSFTRQYYSTLFIEFFFDFPFTFCFCDYLAPQPLHQHL